MHSHTNCSSEASFDDHHHHHHHHGDHGDHDHSHDGPDRGDEYSLYKYIDMTKVICLNEAMPNSVQSIFKPWEQRLDESKYLESDADEQLLIFIPFTGQVKLKTIALKCAPEDSAASTMKVFINQEILDFDTAESTTPIQSFHLLQPSDIQREPIPYPTKLTKFNAVRNLTLYFPTNYGADFTKVFYIGFQGEFMSLNKDPIITLYEAAANPKDHTPFHTLNEMQNNLFSK